jgi:hypothetical protein
MDTDYVVRSARSVTPPRVTYEVVTLHGEVVNVTVPRSDSTPARADATIRAALAGREREWRPVR